MPLKSRPLISRTSPSCTFQSGRFRRRVAAASRSISTAISWPNPARSNPNDCPPAPAQISTTLSLDEVIRIHSDGCASPVSRGRLTLYLPLESKTLSRSGALPDAASWAAGQTSASALYADNGTRASDLTRPQWTAALGVTLGVSLRRDHSTESRMSSRRSLSRSLPTKDCIGGTDVSIRAPKPA